MLTTSAVALALAAHVPVVVHDSRERYPLASVAAAHVAAPGLDHDRRPAVYGRAVSVPTGATWLQYWLFYPDLTKIVGFSGRDVTRATGSETLPMPAGRMRSVVTPTAASVARGFASTLPAGAPSAGTPRASGDKG